MAQAERAWAINREWLVVTLTLVAAYLVLWLIAALADSRPGASWVWPDPARRERYRVVSIVCAVLLGLAAGAARYGSPTTSCGGRLGAAARRAGSARPGCSDPRAGARAAAAANTLRRYSVAAVLVLLVAGVIPGALLFLASYRLHAWSYIKNSQLIVAHRLADRYDRLNETYRLGGAENPRSPAWSSTGVVSDRDIYVDFLYNTSVNRLNEVDRTLPYAHGHERTMSSHDTTHHKDGMLLGLLEDRLPYSPKLRSSGGSCCTISRTMTPGNRGAADPACVTWRPA